jgi:hypothetical protein
VGILLVPQVIYERGEPSWNDIDRENWFVHQSSGSPTSRVI